MLDDAELESFQQLAQQQGLGLSEWVRQALRKAKRAEAVGPGDKKLAAIRAAIQHEFPAPDISEMLSEIERGYGQDLE